MTVLLPRSLHSTYSLGDALREEPIPSTVHAPAPSEADREELVLVKLGARGWGRLHHFRHYYSQGWGDGTGSPLSPRSLEGFHRFLEQVKFPATSKPSLFLTDAGHLELCWEDSGGKTIQVEFTPSGANFYVEAKDEEKSAAFSELAPLAVDLSRL